MRSKFPCLRSFSGCFLRSGHRDGGTAQARARLEWMIRNRSAEGARHHGRCFLNRKAERTSLLFFCGLFMKFAGPSYTFEGVENGASVEAVGGTAGTCTDECLPVGHSSRSVGSLNSSSTGLSRTRLHALETLNIRQSSL